MAGMKLGNAFEHRRRRLEMVEGKKTGQSLFVQPRFDPGQDKQRFDFRRECKDAAQGGIV
jgi:hypothetical protein